MNIFENNSVSKKSKPENDSRLFTAVISEAERTGSFRTAMESVIEHTADYGIENIELLKDDAKSEDRVYTINTLDENWCNVLWNNLNFAKGSRIKMLLTVPVDRAHGYQKGHYKYEDTVKMEKLKVDPTTVYKKQKVDEQDLQDIDTNFDFTGYVKKEMQVKLKEELCRAILFGDGRSETSRDKIDEDCIKPVLTTRDATVYHWGEDEGELELISKVKKNPDTEWTKIVDAVTAATAKYRGGKDCYCFMDSRAVDKVRFAKNSLGKYYYDNLQEVAAEMGVKAIIPVRDWSRIEGVWNSRENALCKKKDYSDDILTSFALAGDMTNGNNKFGPFLFDMDTNPAADPVIKDGTFTFTFSGEDFGTLLNNKNDMINIEFDIEGLPSVIANRWKFDLVTTSVSKLPNDCDALILDKFPLRAGHNIITFKNPLEKLGLTVLDGSVTFKLTANSSKLQDLDGNVIFDTNDDSRRRWIRFYPNYNVKEERPRVPYDPTNLPYKISNVEAHVEMDKSNVLYPIPMGILLDPSDYRLGSDDKGKTAFFERFDIDFNQMKYLLETRASGTLTKYNAAVVIHFTPVEYDTFTGEIVWVDSGEKPDSVSLYLDEV